MAGISRRKVIRFAASASLFAGGQSIAAAAAVNEAGFRKIGGIEQWVAFQGQDLRNPAILYLHGGPGEALSPFLAQFVPWEHDFTVAYWDQRGAGKTYSRNGTSTPDMTLDRLIDDTIEIAELVCDRMSRRR